VKVTSLNNVVYADQFSGSDAFAKINSAIAALPSSGGTVDARGFGAGIQAVSTQLVIGSSTKPVCLIVDANTQFNISTTGAIPAIILNNKSSLVAFNSTNATSATFELTASANVQAILATPSSSCICYIQGVSFAGNASATVSDSLLLLQYVTDMSTIRNVLIWAFYGVGMHLNACAGPILIDNCSINGFGNSGAQPVLVTTGPSSESVFGITFLGCSLTHPGPGGLPIVWLDNVVSNRSVLCGVSFVGTQFESINSGDIGILLENVRGVFGVGLTFTDDGTAGAACIKIVQDNGGTVDNVSFLNVFNQGAWTNTIDDTMNSVTVADQAVSSYKIMSSHGVAERWVGAYGTYGLIAELTTSRFIAPTLAATAATPTGSGSTLSLGNSTGFGNGSSGTAVTTTTKSSGTGPAAPQTIVKYLEIDLGGTKYWVPLMQ
jgi:hypothetical protein